MATANVPSIGKKGKIIHSQAREIIWNVYTYLRHKDASRSKNALLEETSDMTGVSFTAVKTIVGEGASQQPAAATDLPAVAALGTPHFVTPAKKRRRKATVTNLDEFELSVARAS